MVMLADEFPDHGVFGPASLGGTTVSLVVQTADPDAVMAVALEAGADGIRPVADTPHGTRSGWFVDPFGHRWNVTRKRG
jgi:PhnB protein